ncbi:hypothetical protein IFM89_036964 [Coptis chinensis]|uniref:Uncharacterized protein n=1 Tax=Coptis chinensis TaxID=261450 RepID=A0A835LHL5_9MAGN|nr:hypothetical protein IFM89_036964 [Coptis chinensis]
MALVSGGRSMLNPDAPLFIPAVFRQVEDFSPEWWELVTTSTWFHDYWLNQHQEEESFIGNAEDDIANFLPDTIDLGIDEEFPNLEAQLEEWVQYTDAMEACQSTFHALQKEKPQNGLELDMEAFIKSQTMSKSPKQRGPRSPMVSPRYIEKPVKWSPKCSPRRINQPR